jgi:hypothetical protein
MPIVKRAKEKQIAVEASSGNVFEDLGLPDAGERLAKAELARLKRVARVRGDRRTVAGLTSENRE